MLNLQFVHAVHFCVCVIVDAEFVYHDIKQKSLLRTIMISRMMTTTILW